jgi:hypothetical protein
MYNDRQLELVDRFTGKVAPWMIEARRRGVLFDVGHGGGSFLWPVAARAVQQGFVPDTISTDLHSGSINIQQSDMPNVMSKMMLLGMSLGDVVARSTVNPAKAIGRYPELGTLAVGRTADIAVLEEQTGVFAFKDSWPAKRLGTKRLDCVLTIRDGKLAYERGPAPAGEASVVIYDLLLKRVRTGDGKEALDIGIIGNRIAHIRPGLKAAQSRMVAEAEGYDVAPVNLSEGMAADLTLLKASRGVMTIRNGKVITDDEGLTIPDVSRAGPYSNFK